MESKYIEKKLEFMCCFCGKAVSQQEALIIVVYSNINEDEGSQNLYSHKKYLDNKLHKSIPRLSYILEI